VGAPLFPDIVQFDPKDVPPPAPVRAPRSAARAAAALLLGAAAIALLVAELRHLVADSRPSARQVARVALLPDVPPPPPPPKVEHKEEPQPETRPQPRAEKEPKPETPQAPAPIRMEGAAGNGPSPFAAGAVTQDYQGGTPVIGGTGEAPALDRAQQRLYANGVRQALHDEMERQLGPEMPDVDAQVALWIAQDGRISRWELQGAQPSQEPELQSALKRCAEVLQLAAPQSVPQPLRFHLSLRAAG
jgi:hypothetical protein